MYLSHSGPGWFPTTLPLFIITYCLLYTRMIKPLNKKDKISYTLLYLYAFILFDLTQAPFPISKEAIQHIQKFHNFRYNVIPFDGLHLLQFKLNIIFFIPWGILIAWASKEYQWYHVFAVGLITSLAIESLQLITSLLSLNVRSFDVDDLITNTLGALIGYFVVLIYRKIRKKAASQ